MTARLSSIEHDGFHRQPLGTRGAFERYLGAHFTLGYRRAVHFLCRGGRDQGVRRIGDFDASVQAIATDDTSGGVKQVEMQYLPAFGKERPLNAQGPPMHSSS